MQDRRQKLVGQTSSALCSSASQNLAAVLGRHSLAETMLFFSLDLFGLVSSQHYSTPSFRDNVALAIDGTIPYSAGLFRIQYVFYPISFCFAIFNFEKRR